MSKINSQQQAWYQKPASAVFGAALGMMALTSCANVDSQQKVMDSTLLQSEEKNSYSKEENANINPIQHVVVLMLENHSFDNMLGFLHLKNHEIDGLTGNEFNPVDPHDPSKGIIQVRWGSNYYGQPNPKHDFQDVTLQIFGTENPKPEADPKMNGFIKDYTKEFQNLNEKGKVAASSQIMDAFMPDQLPVLSTLASNFVVCDHWFASVPGPTWPNRAYVTQATSEGHLTTPSSGIGGVSQILKAIDGTYYKDKTPTIYDRLTSAHKPWKIYYHDLPLSAVMFPRVRDQIQNVISYKRFKEDVQNNTLPAYSFIEPRWYNTTTKKASDEQNPHDIREGERLIADIYNTLRSSDSTWKSTLFVITYDEHGGHFDHVSPPDAVNPDGINAHDPTFNFNRLGVRVPAVLISPWLPKGEVDHTVYDHTSILKFMENRFNLQPLTARDHHANTFDKDFILNLPREDTPKQIEALPEGKQPPTSPFLSSPGEPNGKNAEFIIASMRELLGVK